MIRSCLFFFDKGTYEDSRLEGMRRDVSSTSFSERAAWWPQQQKIVKKEDMRLGNGVSCLCGNEATNKQVNSILLLTATITHEIQKRVDFIEFNVKQTALGLVSWLQLSNGPLTESANDNDGPLLAAESSGILSQNKVAQLQPVWIWGS
jgi:hypothetical protein